MYKTFICQCGFENYANTEKDHQCPNCKEWYYFLSNKEKEEE